MTTIPASDLSGHGDELLDLVSRGEVVTVTRNGVPAAEIRPVPHGRLTTAGIIRRRRHIPRMDPKALRDDIDAFFGPDR